MILLLTLIVAVLCMSRYAESHKTDHQDNTQASRPETPISKNDASKGTKNTDKPQHPPSWIETFTWPDGVTAWALLLTLLVIAWQSAETRAAAIATEASVEAGKETAKRQLRAYLCVSHAVVTITPQGQIKSRVDIENGGQTPAYNVRSWSHPIITQYPPGDKLKPPPNGLPQGVSIIPSKREQHLPAKPISAGANSAKVIETLGNPNVAYYVHGRIEYVDVFKDAHFVDFRLILGGPATNAVEMDKDGNYRAELSMDSEGNETD